MFATMAANGDLNQAYDLLVSPSRLLREICTSLEGRVETYSCATGNFPRNRTLQSLSRSRHRRQGVRKTREICRKARRHAGLTQSDRPVEAVVPGLLVLLKALGEVKSLRVWLGLNASLLYEHYDSGESSSTMGS